MTEAALFIVLVMALTIGLIVLCPWLGIGLMALLMALYFFGPKVSRSVNSHVDSTQNTTSQRNITEIKTEKIQTPTDSRVDELPVSDDDPVDAMSATGGVHMLAGATDTLALSSSGTSVPSRQHTRFTRQMGEPLNEDEDFDNPNDIDSRVREEWLPGPESHQDKQRQDVKQHRLMRRDQEWSATRRWTKDDKEKFERSRRRLEKEIALALKPDPYMIIEAGPEDTRCNTQKTPFMDYLESPHLWHRRQHQFMMSGTGQLAGRLTNTDID